MPGAPEHRRRIGEANTRAVLAWLLAHPGGTNRECAEAVGLTEMAIGRHVKKIRAMWPIEPAPGGTRQTSESAAMSDTLTFGQKAVGLTFNPSGDDAVAQCKQGFATLIDQMNDLRIGLIAGGAGGEAIRLASVAITEMQTAQMWAVKALTWRD